MRRSLAKKKMTIDDIEFKKEELKKNEKSDINSFPFHYVEEGELYFPSCMGPFEDKVYLGYVEYVCMEEETREVDICVILDRFPNQGFIKTIPIERYVGSELYQQYCLLNLVDRNNPNFIDLSSIYRYAYDAEKIEVTLKKNSNDKLIVDTIRPADSFSSNHLSDEEISTLNEKIALVENEMTEDSQQVDGSDESEGKIVDDDGRESFYNEAFNANYLR